MVHIVGFFAIDLSIFLTRTVGFINRITALMDLSEDFLASKKVLNGSREMGVRACDCSKLISCHGNRLPLRFSRADQFVS